MFNHAGSLAFAAALATAGAATAQGLKPVATIALPGVPINNLGTMVIDSAARLGFLAEKENKAVVVFDTKADAFVSRVTGFVGNAKDGIEGGPNGVIVVNGGANLFVSDGDSTVKVVDVKASRIVATLATGGKMRANNMAYDPANRIVLLANSNEEVPFLSLISTEPGYRILAKIPVPQSGENLERSVFQASSGMFWTAIPVLKSDISKGILAQVESKTGRLVKLHELEGCHPHSLQLVSETTIFLGCSSAHAPAPKPGGDLAIFDIGQGKIAERGAGLGGNGSSDLNPAASRYYHATTAATLVVVDTRTRQLVEKISTSQGARSVAVDPATGKVYLATTAKDGPCGGCIQVYAP